MMKPLDRPSTTTSSISEAGMALAVWALIYLVFFVLGAYAALSAPPASQLEILPGPDRHPLPVPALVSPTPPDAELVASAQ